MKARLAMCALLTCVLAPPGWPQTPAAPAPAIKADKIDTVMTQSTAVFLDVRTPAEVKKNGTLPGAINIPIEQLTARMGELPKDRALVVACEGGGRAFRAGKLLQEHGYRVVATRGLHDYQGKTAFPESP